jgi:hypothetical protein
MYHGTHDFTESEGISRVSSKFTYMWHKMPRAELPPRTRTTQASFTAGCFNSHSGRSSLLLCWYLVLCLSIAQCACQASLCCVCAPRVRDASTAAGPIGGALLKTAHCNARTARSCTVSKRFPGNKLSITTGGRVAPAAESCVHACMRPPNPLTASQIHHSRDLRRLRAAHDA